MSSKLLEHPGALCNIVRRVAIEAGGITLEYFDESGFGEVDLKADGSPVTIADHKAEEFIGRALKDTLPDIAIVSEEAAARGECASCAGVEYFWLVDALDGTRQFVEGNDEYTVNIALIRNGSPVLGVVYAPARGELYAAHGEGTAIRWLEETDKEKEIRIRKPVRGGATVMVSRHFGTGAQMDAFLEDYKVEKIIRRGSSLKLCAIASGKADLYPRFGPSHEWDVAAGHAVLLGAGGLVTDMSGRPLSYGQGTSGFANPDFVAKTPYMDDLDEAEV
jgi:3'(2'), 5'-bisphosphate nucleotidase